MILHSSSFIYHPSFIILHSSSFIYHPSFIILHYASFISRLLSFSACLVKLLYHFYELHLQYSTSKRLVPTSLKLFTSAMEEDSLRIQPCHHFSSSNPPLELERQQWIDLHNQEKEAYYDELKLSEMRVYSLKQLYWMKRNYIMFHQDHKTWSWLFRFQALTGLIHWVEHPTDFSFSTNIFEMMK